MFASIANYFVVHGWQRGGPVVARATRDADAAEHIPAIKKAIADLEKPLPKVIDAYAKFGGENSPMERAANRAKKAAALKNLLAEMEKAVQSK